MDDRQESTERRTVIANLWHHIETRHTVEVRKNAVIATLCAVAVLLVVWRLP
jgi:hypothetical protein